MVKTVSTTTLLLSGKQPTTALDIAQTSEGELWYERAEQDIQGHTRTICGFVIFHDEPSIINEFVSTFSLEPKIFP